MQGQLEHLREAAAIAGVRISGERGPTVRDVVSNRVRLSVLEWGSSQAPTIVLVHGGALTAHTWDLVCACLCDRYRCLAVDLRGHGDSEWPADADYSLDAISRDLSEFIAAECAAAPVLIGMSLGGLASIEVAANGMNLSGLVIVDVGPEVRSEGAHAIVNFTSTDQEMPSVEEFVVKAVAFNPLRRPELLRRSLLHNLRQLPNGNWTWKWDPRRMNEVNAQMMARNRSRLWKSVRKIRCRTLVVRGARSPVFWPEDASRLTAALRTAESVEVRDAGHTVQGDNPRGFLEVLVPFLDQVLPA